MIFSLHRCWLPKVNCTIWRFTIHTEVVIEKICNCGGGVLHGKKFKYIEDTAKVGAVHKGSNGLVKSMISYGNETRRTESFSAPDLIYASKALSNNIMQMFWYNTIPLPS